MKLMSRMRGCEGGRVESHDSEAGEKEVVYLVRQQGSGQVISMPGTELKRVMKELVPRKTGNAS